MMMYHQPMPDTVLRVPRDLPLADLKSTHHAKLISSPVDGRIDYSIWCNFLGNYGLGLGMHKYVEP